MHAPTHPHTHTRTHARQSVCVSGRDHRPQAARAPDFVDRGENTRARGSKVGAERERMGIRLGSGPAACVRLPHARRLAPNYAPGSSGWGQLTHGMCALCPGEDRFFFVLHFRFACHVTFLNCRPLTFLLPFSLTHPSLPAALSPFFGARACTLASTGEAHVLLPPRTLRKSPGLPPPQRGGGRRRARERVLRQAGASGRRGGARSESADGAGGESRASLHPSTTLFILSSPVSLPLDHSPHGAHPDRHEPVSL